MQRVNGVVKYVNTLKNAPYPKASDVIAERERRLALGFDYDFGDERGVHHIAIEPYGSVTTQGTAYRQPKQRVDFYNLLNNNVTLGFSGGFVPGVRGWQTPSGAGYMNPRIIRLNAEFAF